MALSADEPLEVRVGTQLPDLADIPCDTAPPSEARPAEAEPKAERSPEVLLLLARCKLILMLVLDLLTLGGMVYVEKGFDWLVSFAGEKYLQQPHLEVMHILGMTAVDVIGASILAKDVWIAVLYLWGKGKR